MDAPELRENLIRVLQFVKCKRAEQKLGESQESENRLASRNIFVQLKTNVSAHQGSVSRFISLRVVKKFY